MKLLALPLVTTALMISAAQGSYLSWPLTFHFVPSVLATVSPGFSDAIGPDTISGRSKCSQIRGTYTHRDSVTFILAAGDKNGGEKNGEDNDETEKDDKKDKDEGGGWDRLWDSPMLG
jgi:hypothetical protein